MESEEYHQLQGAKVQNKVNLPARQPFDCEKISIVKHLVFFFRTFLVVTFGFSVLLIAPGNAQAAEVPIQGVLYGGGCGDPLKISAISRSGKVTKTRTIVRGNPRYIMEPGGTTGSKFLFKTITCTPERQTSIYRQYLGVKPKPELLLTVPNSLKLVGVTWATGGFPAILVHDSAYNYFIQALFPQGWTVLWTGSRSDFDGKFPTDIDARSGCMFHIVASDAFGAEWSEFSVKTENPIGCEGYKGYMNRELTGPGDMYEMAPQPFDRQKVFIGPDGSYICDWSARGTMQDAILQGKCVNVVGGAGYYGVTVLADDPHSWLFIDSRVGSSSRTKYQCVGGNYLSCVSPVLGKRESQSLNSRGGYDYVYLGQEKKSLGRKFKKFGASRI